MTNQKQGGGIICREGCEECYNWTLHRKTALARMVRMNGPFSVQTREGVVTCQDGWLCLDSGGYPYPLADEEYRRMYESADTPPPSGEAVAERIVRDANCISVGSLDDITQAERRAWKSVANIARAALAAQGATP